MVLRVNKLTADFSFNNVRLWLRHTHKVHQILLQFMCVVEFGKRIEVV